MRIKLIGEVLLLTHISFRKPLPIFKSAENNFHSTAVVEPFLFHKIPQICLKTLFIIILMVTIVPKWQRKEPPVITNLSSKVPLFFVVQMPPVQYLVS